MSSWNYAFLFPGPKYKLSPDKAVNCLAIRGIEFDGRVRMCIAIDEAGHLLDVGDEQQLTLPLIDDVARRMQHNDNFSIQCRNSEIAITCFFALDSANPHVFFAWSQRGFTDLSQTIQEEYWSMIRHFAKACNAAYVIVVNDASDHFEDRFIDIDGLRFFDTTVTHNYGHGVQEIWINQAVGGKLPDGIGVINMRVTADGYHLYRVH